VSARQKPKVISLFTGAGGLDFGLEAAGFRTCAAIENDPDACDTLKFNRENWNVISKNIFEITADELLSTAGLKRRGVDLVAGGPPCQPFSKAGNWARKNGRAPGLRDDRASTVIAFMDVVQKVLPKVVLLENVEGFAAGGENSGEQLVLRRFEEINASEGTKYKPCSSVLDAADYGVPQARRRRFIVAERSGKEFTFPQPTHGENRQQHITAWDVLGDEEPPESEDLQLSGKWADLLPTIPEGENYCWHTSRGGGKRLFGWRCRYWTFLLKLSKRRPSWTIQAHPGPASGPFHWKNRKLSIRELCRLQTFPHDVEIKGGRMAAMRQVGNAVPSLLAEVLGRAIRRQLLGQHPRYELTLLPERRESIPPAEVPAPLPKKYLPLIGDYPDHPGPGEGPGAKKRQENGAASTGKMNAA
jgi:DNA (cytosine-5)-methyltransferase 1